MLLVALALVALGSAAGTIAADLVSERLRNSQVDPLVRRLVVGWVRPLVLLVAIVQLPPLLVLAPVIVYVFSTSSTTVAVVFTIWSVLVGALDNVLKPMLMGRGVEVPMLVIFMGAIGGFLADGIIGLFVGAVVLALGYSLFTAWLAPAAAADETHS